MLLIINLILNTLLIAILGLYNNKRFLKKIVLFFEGLILINSLLAFSFLDGKLCGYQQVINYNLSSYDLAYTFIFGVDGISIFFIILSNFLVFLCVLFTWNEIYYKDIFKMLLLIQIMLNITFSTLDLFIFYIFFEALLIPMFMLIGFWGSRNRKIRALYLFFFYTLCGSILFLVGIFYIVNHVGNLSYEFLINYAFSSTEQKFLWLAFFISFASKIPMFPFHIWLPEAHVEAPTIGSVLLAGILLKLGVYGFIRFIITIFLVASHYYLPLVLLLAVIGVIFGSLSAVRQMDLKRIIAYSSIAHMNVIVLGIFSFSAIGLYGAIFQSLSHGFVSGGLFILIGYIYDRYHTRDIINFSGLVHIMPIYIFLFFIFTLANIAVPGTSSFVGEFFLLAGIFTSNVTIAVIGSLSVILCGSYSLWLYNRVSYGNYFLNFKSSSELDLNIRELVIITPLLLLVLYTGLYPSTILFFLDASIHSLIGF